VLQKVGAAHKNGEGKGEGEGQVAQDFEVILW